MTPVRGVAAVIPAPTGPAPTRRPAAWRTRPV